MRFVKLLCAAGLLSGVWMSLALAETPLGAQGPESEPARRQAWLIPKPDATGSARALLFRPAGDGPFPLAIIAAASPQKPGGRAQPAQLEYRTLSRWLVARGYAVLVTEPSAQALPAGRPSKDISGCDDASYLRAGRASADSIVATLNYMRGSPFVKPDGNLIVGHSEGGWGALAMAGRDLSGISAIVVFAPERAARASDKARQSCPPQRAIAAASEFGKDAHLPVVWMVARNDTHVPPAVSRQMADAFRAGGDKVDFRALPEFRGEGHALAEAEGGDELYGATLDSALKAITTRPARKR
jgi:dienelactone hydrolase